MVSRCSNDRWGSSELYFRTAAEVPALLISGVWRGAVAGPVPSSPSALCVRIEQASGRGNLTPEPKQPSVCSALDVRPCRELRGQPRGHLSRANRGDFPTERSRLKKQWKKSEMDVSLPYPGTCAPRPEHCCLLWSRPWLPCLAWVLLWQAGGYMFVAAAAVVWGRGCDGAWE